MNFNSIYKTNFQAMVPEEKLEYWTRIYLKIDGLYFMEQNKTRLPGGNIQKKAYIMKMKSKLVKDYHKNFKSYICISPLEKWQEVGFLS